MASLLDIPEDVADEPWFIEAKDKNPSPEIKRQGLFLSRLRVMAPAVDALAVPNAGKSTDWERIQRWREGARRGALDLIIAWKTGVFFAEFKNGTAMPDKDQRERLNRYYRMGHGCGVYRNPDTLLAHLRLAGAPFIAWFDQMGFAGKPQFYGRKVRTRLDKVAAAANLIAYCTPERFVTLTADAVARHSGAPLATCEQMLASARERRS